MKFKINAPQPVKPPPKTFDILGLTYDETLAIRVALLHAATGGSLSLNIDKPLMSRLHDEITRGTGS